MPRAQSETQTLSVTKPKKAPAKRVTGRAKKTTTTRTATKQRTTTRRRTTAATAESDKASSSVRNTTTATPIRKAPTPIAATSAKSKQAKVILVVASTVSMIFVITGIYIGTTDSGTVDVNAIIAAGNEKISRGEYVDSRTGQTITRTISTQSSEQRTNSGLRASADTPAQNAAVDEVTEVIDSATSSPETVNDEASVMSTTTSTTTPASDDATEEEVEENSTSE